MTTRLLTGVIYAWLLMFSYGVKAEIKAYFTKTTQAGMTYYAPTKMPTKIFNSVRVMPIADGYIEAPAKPTEKFTIAYIITDIQRNKIIRKYERTMYLKGKNFFRMNWNFLADADLIDSDLVKCSVEIFVKHDNKFLVRKIIKANVGKVKKSISFVNKYIVSLNRELPKKIELEGVNIINAGGSYLTGREGCIWAMLGGVLCGADVLNVRVSWKSVEANKGKYTWRFIDKVIAYAERLKIPIILSFVNGNNDMPLWWYSSENVAKTNSNNQRLLMPSYNSLKFKDSINASIKKIVERYKNKNIIIGWHFNIFNNDGFYDDTHGHWLAKNPNAPEKLKYLYDYSSLAQSAFQDYLEKKYKNINKINSIYRCKYKKFDDISIPQPLWKKCDRRPIWSDFTDFKLKSAADFMGSNFASIRDVDSKRWVITFGLKNGNLIPYLKVLKKYNAILNYSVFGPISFSASAYLAKQAGVKCLTEEDAPFLRNGRLDRGGFESKVFENMVSGVSGTYTMNAYWGTCIFPDIYCKWKNIFKEVVGAKPVAPLLGINISPYYWLARYKTFYYYYDTVGHESQGTYIFSFNWLRKFILNKAYSHEVIDSSYRFDKNRYPVIIDADSNILSSTAINRLAKYVKNGGVLICTKFSKMLPWNSKLSFWKKIKCSNYTLTTRKSFNFGKGKVILIPGDVDWRNTEYQNKLANVLRRNGIQSRVICNTSNIRLSLLKKGPKYFITAYNDNKEQKELKFKVFLSDNDSKKNFELCDMFKASSLGTYTGETLRKNGILITIPGRRALVISLDVK